jgi:hypothetical protein
MTPWLEHGALQVAATGRYLHHRDGTEFFWLGDTAWHLARLTPEDVERYLAHRASKGFTVVLIYAAQDPNPPFGGRNYAGEIAFVGDAPPFATVQLNERYWQHIDRIVDRAAAHGLYIALAPAWGLNLAPGKRAYFTAPETHNYELGLHLGRRYSDRPNLIWIACSEYQTPYDEPLPPEHRARLLRMVQGLRDGDQGDHLLTIHPLSRYSSSDDFHHEVWLDFNMIQTHVYHDYIDSLVSGDWQKEPVKPTLNAEGWYEGEEALHLQRVGIQKSTPFDPGWIQRYQAYWSLFAGSFGYTYGHARLWTMLGATQTFPDDLAAVPGILDEAILNAPGVSYFGPLRALVTAKPAQSRQPDQTLLTLNTLGSDGTLAPNWRCALRDVAGRWAYIYSTRGEPIGVLMHKLAAGHANAHWYDPRTGQWHVAGRAHPMPQPFATDLPTGLSAASHYFYPPGTPADGNDWVLVLEVLQP